ncbi:hypothetical protein [Novipirellula caenicola]|uniref:Periplasmic folding chaperone n=1 Tax=Novipirellula caenicola TaxID=1536901 RepID=A0ABP9VK14_9BACT
MNNSPFEIFRKNLKPMMVFLIMLAMFSFVVLPALDTYLRQNTGGGGDAKLASFDGIEISQNRISYMTQNHHSTVRFLRELAEKTIAAGGSPKTPGFRYDDQNNRVASIGISEMPSEQLSLKTMQFASEANKAGFELDDAAIGAWLNLFVDDRFTDKQIDALLMESTRNQMGRVHLYEQLRSHLLADLYNRAGFAVVAAGQMPIMTPAEEWTNFLKLNREATATAYGIPVESFVSKTDPKPSESAIKAMYERGKDRDPNDQSPEPAFHRQYTAEFEYLVADLQSFIDEEAVKFSEEELRAEYERRLAGGDFQLPEDPATQAADDAAMADGLETELVETEVMETETATESPAEESPKEESTSEPEPKAEQPKEEKPAAQTDEEEMTAEESAETEEAKPADEATEGDANEDDAKPEAETDATSESAEDEKPASEDAEGEESSDESADDSDKTSRRSKSMNTDNGIRLVAFQDTSDEAESDEPESDSEPASEEPAEKPADEKKPDEKKADEKTEEAEKEDKAADEAKPEMNEASGEEKPADEKPADKPSEPETKQPETESFEAVREEIADSLARPIAEERMGKATAEMFSQMRRYFNQHAIYSSDVKNGLEVEELAPFDLKKLGEKYGFRYQKIGPYTETSIQAEPIAQTVEVGTQQMRRGPAFTTFMYGGQTQMGEVPRQVLYSPLRTVDDRGGKTYISWKIDERKAYTPKLEEVREEVIAAVRLSEARKLAMDAAAELAAKANKSGAELTELVPEENKDEVKTGLGPFSWLDSFGFQGASIGNVPELNSVGEEFMKAVFNSEVGQYAAAMNMPESVAYVVKPTNFQPSMDELKVLFQNPRDRMMAMLAGGGSTNDVIQGFYESVDERTDFSYAREEESNDDY